MKIADATTERLRLRRWREEDREPFFQMCQDPDVKCYLLPITNRAASNAFIERLENHFDTNGFGMCAAERCDTGEFIGIIGLQVPRILLTTEPCVEAGWRLCRSAWGQGFAQQRAAAAIEAGFSRLGLTEIVAVTAIQNERSWRVMERLGMLRDAKTFAHPALAADHPLSEHFLYRKQRGQSALISPALDAIRRISVGFSAQPTCCHATINRANERKSSRCFVQIA